MKQAQSSWISAKIKAKIKVSFLCISILLSVFFTVNAQAQLHLELTQGENAALPIAVIPFAGANVQAPGGQSIAAIVHDDLQNSGQFVLKTPAFTGPINFQNQNQINWRAQGVDYALIGSIQPMGSQYQISIQLLSIYGQGGNGQPQVLMTRQFTASQGGLRQLAHHISDLVFQQLTGFPGVANTKIAYVLLQRFQNGQTQYTLDVADADGFNAQSLLVTQFPIMSPSWSPDGRYLAYVSFEGNRSGIYLQNVSSGQRSLISNAPGINGAPAFSPDGRQLALVLTKTGNPNIYIMDLSSKQLKQITNGYSIDTEPSWSPDGRSLLFTSDRGGHPQIYRYDFASGQVTRITYQGDYNARASYTADGKAIIMMHRESGSFGIAKQDLANGQLISLAHAGVDESPSVAPNGKMVLYATQYGGRGVLAVTSVDGRIKLRLPSPSGDVQEPAWSPFLDRNG